MVDGVFVLLIVIHVKIKSWINHVSHGHKCTYLCLVINLLRNELRSVPNIVNDWGVYYEIAYMMLVI